MSCNREPESCSDLSTMVWASSSNWLHSPLNAGDYKEALGNCLCYTNGEWPNACDRCKEKVREVLGCWQVLKRHNKQ